MTFKDHFSRQSPAYAKYRPRYPRALFAFIAAQTPNDEVALDCATGNGQAALVLAEFFRKVIALDASAAQLASAPPRENVEYRVAPAEATGLATASCDAIVVAQALHWFDLEAFYGEARRILRPGGVLAAWSYDHLRIAPAVDAIITRYHDQIVGPFWPPERRLVGHAYRALPFPFAEIPAPEFEMVATWSLEHLLGYLGSWSATQRFLEANGRDPLDLITPELKAAWGSEHPTRTMTWPLIVRVGRV